MTYLRNCVNCRHAKQHCARRVNLLASLKGLGITSAKFRCHDRAPIFGVGERVSVEWPVPDGSQDDWGRTHYTLESWPATVICERGSRFVVLVDDVDSDHETPAREYITNPTLHAKVSPTRLTKLDEPRRSVCTVCHEVAGHGECFGSEGVMMARYRPFGCLAKALAQATEAEPITLADLAAGLACTCEDAICRTDPTCPTHGGYSEQV